MPTKLYPIKQEENHPAQSLGVTLEKAISTPDFKSDKARIFSFRKTDFILDHIFSIGLKSGLYGGRKITLIFSFSITFLTAL